MNHDKFMMNQSIQPHFHRVINHIIYIELLKLGYRNIAFKNKSKFFNLFTNHKIILRLYQSI